MKVRFAVAPHAGSLSSAGLREFVAAIEAAGFDAIWLSDLPVTPALDPLLGLALAAGCTRRVRLGANVVPLGRNPFLLAKSLAQLDQICEGRLLLNFVTGLNQPGEGEALDVADAGRGAVVEEVLALLRRWWAGHTVDHHSERWSFTGLGGVARPRQDPLEVWLGGRGRQALDRVGRVGDGWLGAQLTPAEAAVARERIHASARRAGREIDPEHFGLSLAYARARPAPAVLEGLRARRPAVDPLAVLPVGRQALRELIAAYMDAGLSKFVIRPAAPVAAWNQEAPWLAEAILDLQS